MSYFYALLGGVIIGLAAATTHYLLGRVAGISGIAGRVLAPERSERDWRSLFLLGLVAGGGLLVLIAPSRFATASATTSGLTIVIAGLLVGFGSRLSCGCTSGHGVCGVTRFSMRSILATLTFITSGAITVALVH